MPLMCDHCFKLYKKKYHPNLYCKEKECFGELVEIDENLLMPIYILNKKGYFTMFCCGSCTLGYSSAQ